MSQLLHLNTVLVLNRNWQAISITTPAHAFCQMSSANSVGLDIPCRENFIPTPWERWLELPVRGHDQAIGTPRGRIRIPTVLVLSRFCGIPMIRPKLNSRGIWHRDGGRCQYTGRSLRPNEASIDHINPRSRGGTNSWENCVLADRKINTRKANRTPQEAGMRLLKEPRSPRPVPVTLTLRNLHDISDWDLFLASA
jgi:5-methylcytosine-specific restriction endonuclease McrA